MSGHRPRDVTVGAVGSDGTVALPQPVKAAAWRLLSAAVAVKIAAELGEASEARRAAHDVLSALDDIANSAPLRAVNHELRSPPSGEHHQPDLWAYGL